MTHSSLDLAQWAARIDNEQHRKNLPPLESWNPPFSGDMDMRIARDGTWYHEGRPIQRKALVRLFSTLLKREGDDYFLVTPVEKYRIQVEDAPFAAIDVTVREIEGETLLEFETSVGDRVVVDGEHPIRVETDAGTGEPSPYVRVRAGLEARLVRSVFYAVVALAREHEEAGRRQWTVTSAGQRFVLGVAE